MMVGEFRITFILTLFVNRRSTVGDSASEKKWRSRQPGRKLEHCAAWSQRGGESGG